MIPDSWKSLDPDIDTFLTEFRGDDGSAHFADRFIAADPNRAVVTDKATLAGALPARRAMFANAGIGAIDRIDAAQLDLDPRHLLVTADWEAQRAEGAPLRLESTFLLRREDDGPRIVVYLNHRDIAAMLTAPVPPGAPGA